MALRVLFLIAGVCILISGCSSVNTAALGTKDVNVRIRDYGLFCTLEVRTNPTSCDGIAGAQSGDICLYHGDTIRFKSLKQRNNQFVIVPEAPNPLVATDGSGAGCAVISKNGILDCKVQNLTAEDRFFKYWVFGQGCSQSLDPRIYVFRPR